MMFSSTVSDPLHYDCRVLVVPIAATGRRAPLYKAIDKALGGAPEALFNNKEFTAELGKTAVINSLGQLPAERVLLVGLGKKEQVTAEEFRQVAAAAASCVRGLRTASCSLVMDSWCDDLVETAEAAAIGFRLGTYTFDHYRTVRDKLLPPVEDVTFLCRTKKDQTVCMGAVCAGEAIADAVSIARDLVFHPGNVATPSYIAEQAVTLAKTTGFTCTVLEQADLEQLGMGGLLAVAAGSVQPPKCVVLEYTPCGASVRPVALVGKGVTFDSGGISLKPREGMEQMKDDMAGAAAVLGTFVAAAELKLPVNLVGVIPLAENLPDGKAYKPGDVITTMSGKTVEINNTDAEGRMLLCDALHYVQRFKPRAIIDLATLTGACLVALGTIVTGMLGTDESLKRSLKRAGEASGERVWELPLWDEYGDAMKSDIADMKNAGGPHAGTITAGWFLKQFIDKTPWVHLDIAGTAWEDKGKHYLPKGATGVGVRLLVTYLRSLVK
jgi:leucyl aminopeptidase